MRSQETSILDVATAPPTLWIPHLSSKVNPLRGHANAMENVADRLYMQIYPWIFAMGQHGRRSSEIPGESKWRNMRRSRECLFAQSLATMMAKGAVATMVLESFELTSPDCLLEVDC